ncbi:MAG: hypothetical protein RMX96_31670 [Nostoc sp. ChiSLP02]|nr:hypothetical protein [Nostoc sp. DedSLP05]MDZ8100984.1 hypothetical protein [Nostoc sp. DedSLP01]MDZ8189383.1 hypothetical protein [Nostoc sp. ChiSLP02]
MNIADLSEIEEVSDQKLSNLFGGVAPNPYERSQNLNKVFGGAAFKRPYERQPSLTPSERKPSLTPYERQPSIFPPASQDCGDGTCSA